MSGFDPRERDPSEVGHIYLARIVEDNESVFVKLFVVAMDPDSWVVLRWGKAGSGRGAGDDARAVTRRRGLREANPDTRRRLRYPLCCRSWATLRVDHATLALELV